MFLELVPHVVNSFLTKFTLSHYARSHQWFFCSGIRYVMVLLAMELTYIKHEVVMHYLMCYHKQIYHWKSKMRFLGQTKQHATIQTRVPNVWYTYRTVTFIILFPVVYSNISKYISIFRFIRLKFPYSFSHNLNSVQHFKVQYLRWVNS